MEGKLINLPFCHCKQRIWDSVSWKSLETLLCPTHWWDRWEEERRSQGELIYFNELNMAVFLACIIQIIQIRDKSTGLPATITHLPCHLPSRGSTQCDIRARWRCDSGPLVGRSSRMIRCAQVGSPLSSKGGDRRGWTHVLLALYIHLCICTKVGWYFVYATLCCTNCFFFSFNLEVFPCQYT